MSNNFGAPFDALQDGQALTFDEVDWDVVSEILDVDFDEFDDYDFYITDRIHPIVFIKGDLKVDGSCHTHELAAGRDGLEVEYKSHPNIAKAVQVMNMGVPEPGRYFDKDGNEVDIWGNPI